VDARPFRVEGLFCKVLASDATDAYPVFKAV
jgi:hypothetical protein